VVNERSLWKAKVLFEAVSNWRQGMMEVQQQNGTRRKNLLCRGNCRRSALYVFLFLGVTGVFASKGWAQGTNATLGGRVTDPSQHVIAKADVAVTSEDTGVVIHATTNGAGLWQINSLIAGNYRFTVTESGFETLEHTAIDLQIGDVKSVDVQMKVGSVNVDVVVDSETPLIDTTAAVSGVVLNSTDLEELPSLSGSPLDLAVMAPGVYLPPPTGGGTSLWSNSSLSEFSVNGAGSSTNAVNYVLDGATDTIVSSGAISFIPPTDAVGQMRVQTNSYDASIGRTAAGTINMSLKSGTNQFHGVLSEREQNTAFNANLSQNKAVGVAPPGVHFHEYGGTIGGPVMIPKIYDGKRRGTFFFFSFDGVQAAIPSKNSYLSIPTPDEIKGDYSNSNEIVNNVAYKVRIFDPLTIDSSSNRTEFQNDIIPSGRISPIAKALVASLPAPNVPLSLRDPNNTDKNDFLETNPQIDHFYSLILRMDESWNNSHHSYIDLRRNQFRQFTNDNYGPNNILANEALNRDNYGLTVNHTWVLNPKTILTINANETMYRYFFGDTASTTDPTQYGFSQTFANSEPSRGLPQFNGILGLSSVGDVYGPTQENDYQTEARGYITQIVGTHSLRYGGEYLLSQESVDDRSGETGSYTFDSIWTRQNPNATAPGGQDEANPGFLLGLPHTGSITQSSKAFWKQPFVAAYVQDDWRVTPKLTLDLGLRWDLQLNLTERGNQYFSRYDPDANVAPVTSYAQPLYAAVIQGSPSKNTGVAFLQQYQNNVAAFQAKGAIEYAGVNGVSTAVADLRYKYFQPRLGFAYAFNPKLVIRGGVGRFVQATFSANHGNQLGYSTSTPFVSSNDNYRTTAATLDNPYPNGLVPQTGNSLGVLTSVGSVSSFYNPDPPRQYTDDLSLHLQQQLKDFLIEIGGVAGHTKGLNTTHQIDNPSLAAWYAAYTPTFSAIGEPVMTLAANQAVTNPFKGAPYITSTLETNTTVSAFQLSRPNPLVNGISESDYDGSSTNYALQTRVQRRYRNGFGLLSTFVWGKQMTKTSYFTPSVYSQKLHNQLSGNDRRFQVSISPTYILPFGRGKLIGSRVSHGVDRLIGGWELTAIYSFYSGTPLSLPTNTAFFQGGDPADGIKHKSKSQWFNTDKFRPFPLQNTTKTQLDSYPTWTGVQGMPGYDYVPTSPTAVTLNGVYQDFATHISDNPTTYGTVRNPYQNNWNIGIRKNIPLAKSIYLQMRLDAFNALNHPQGGNVDVAPGDQYFGWVGGSNLPSQVNSARVVQVAAKLYY
jgi:hypothetical protein